MEEQSIITTTKQREMHDIDSWGKGVIIFYKKLIESLDINNRYDVSAREPWSRINIVERETQRTYQIQISCEVNKDCFLFFYIQEIKLCQRKILIEGRYINLTENNFSRNCMMTSRLNICEKFKLSLFFLNSTKNTQGVL